MERKIKIEDKGVAELIRRKLEVLKVGLEGGTRMKELEKEHNELKEKLAKEADKINDLKAKITPKVEKLLKGQLGEYEVYHSTDIIDGVVYAIVIDELEQFKTRFEVNKKK